MSGDPKEYRQNAWRCVELANSSRSPDLKQTFLNLSKTWVKLAVEIERSRALIDIDTGPHNKPA